LLEVTDTPGKTNDTFQQKPGTDTGQCQVREVPLIQRDPPQPLSSRQTNIRDDDTVDATEALTSQHYHTHKPEDTQPAPGALRKLGMIKSQTHHQNGHAERPGVSLTRMGKFMCHSHRPHSLTTLLDVISAHDVGNKTLNSNVITKRTKVGMSEYSRPHDLDITFLYQVIDPELLPMPAYDIY
jgi:hypothetical protein